MHLHLNPRTHEWQICDDWASPPDDEPGWFVAHIFEDVNMHTWAVWVRRIKCDCGGDIQRDELGFWFCESKDRDGAQGVCNACQNHWNPPHL